MKKVVGVVLVIALVVCLFTACSNDTSTGVEETAGETAMTSETDEASAQDGGGEKQTVKIGVSLFAFNRPWFQQVVLGLDDGVEKYADEYDIELLYFDPQGEVEDQIQGVENLISQKVDALLLQPISPTSLAGALETATEDGIPIFLLDTTLEGTEYVSWVGSNNEEIGTKGAELVVEYLTEKYGEEKGQVILLDSMEMSTLRARSKGFQEYIADYPNIEIVANGDMENDTAKSFDLTTNFLQSNPDVDCIFAPNDASSSGAYNAILSAGKEDQVFVVGGDAQTDTLNSILGDGVVKALVVQQPMVMGSTSVDSIISYLQGETVEQIVYSDLLIVDATNAQEQLDLDAALQGNIDTQNN